MKRVFFIRHAESAANAGLKTQLDGSIPLSALGHEQSKKLAETFLTVPELVITSAFLRTQQTAEHYIKRHSLQPEVWDVHEFSYLNPQVFQNTTTFERRESVEKYWKDGDIYHNSGDGAESFYDFANRVIEMRKKLTERKESTIVIFSHGYFITLFAFIDQIMNAGKTPTEKDFQEYMLEHSAFLQSGGRFKIENTSVHEFEY